MLGDDEDIRLVHLHRREDISQVVLFRKCRAKRLSRISIFEILQNTILRILGQTEKTRKTRKMLSANVPSLDA